MANLNLPPFTSPRFTAIHPDTGRPVSYGTVEFYVPRTSTAKPIYADSSGENIATNPLRLDAAGSGVAYLKGPYRVVVRAAPVPGETQGAVLWDADDVNSVVAETPAGNPGSLIAANNLSDVPDPALARATLGLATQANTTDRTPGALMMVGAFGLGGYAPAVTATGALSDLTRLTSGYLRVAAADAATVGAPAGAGVCHTLRFGADTVAQVYHPVTGTNPTPWRRIYSLSAWSPWVRDFDNGSDSNGTWERNSGGWQRCVASVTFTYDSASAIKATWTFPKAFASAPTVTYSLINATLTGIQVSEMGNLVSTVSGSSAGLSLRRSSTTVEFDPGDTAVLRVTAEGRWLE